MYCTKCGKEIEKNSNFCTHCGSPIEKAQNENVGADNTELEKAVARFQNGDQTAFDTIYKGVVKNAIVLVKSFFPNEEANHEDIIQDIFIHVYKKINLYEPEKASFVTWFQKVAENKCIDRYRALQKKAKKLTFVSMESLKTNEHGEKEVEFEDERIEFNPSAVMEKNEISRLIRELMDNIPEKQKQCLTLKFLAHYEIQEIAEKLGIPIGTVKSRLFKAKENLSIQVFEMEKRGVKLYGMSPVAFFVWLLTQDVEAEAASLPALKMIRDAIISNEAFSGKDGSSINEPLPQKSIPTDTDQGETIVSKEHQLNKTQLSVKIGSSAAKAVTGKAVSSKILAGIIGIAVVAGTGFAISYADTPDNKADTPIENPSSKENIDDTKHATENISLLSVFDDKEKKKQLETILALAPVFDENNAINTETLWNNVFTKSGINITVLKRGTTQLDVSTITALDSVEIDMKKYEIVLPVHAYDMVFQALNIPSEKLDELSKEGYLHYDKKNLYLSFGESSIGPYAASITDMQETGDTLDVSFALSYDSSDPDVAASHGDEKYIATIKTSENSLGYVITSVKPAEADEQNSSSETIYEPLIHAYGQAYYSGLENLPDIMNEGSSGLFNPYHGLLELPSDEYPTIYYALHDINDDGYEECFFTSTLGTEKSDYPGYYDIWTNDGITSHHLLEGGYRTSQIILENGEILNFGSGGATYGEYSVYSFLSNGSCTLEDSYQYDTYTEEVELEIKDFLEKYPRKDVTFEWKEIPVN